jgi:hypothetical protein
MSLLFKRTGTSGFGCPDYENRIYIFYPQSVDEIPAQKAIYPEEHPQGKVGCAHCGFTYTQAVSACVHIFSTTTPQAC